MMGASCAIAPSKTAAAVCPVCPSDLSNRCFEPACLMYPHGCSSSTRSTADRPLTVRVSQAILPCSNRCHFWYFCHGITSNLPAASAFSLKALPLMLWKLSYQHSSIVSSIASKPIGLVCHAALARSHDLLLAAWNAGDLCCTVEASACRTVSVLPVSASSLQCKVVAHSELHGRERSR
jgi:hypothetical protein